MLIRLTRKVLLKLWVAHLRTSNKCNLSRNNPLRLKYVTVQPVVLNVDLWLDFTAAARNEDLVHSIDYAQLADHLQAFIKESRFQLVETLVLETAKFILDHYPKALTTQVSVCKPNAIPQSKGAMASIKVSR